MVKKSGMDDESYRYRSWCFYVYFDRYIKFLTKEEVAL